MHPAAARDSAGKGSRGHQAELILLNLPAFILSLGQGVMWVRLALNF